MQRHKCRKCGATMKKHVRMNHITTYPHNSPQFAFPVYRSECKDCGYFERDSTGALHLKCMRETLKNYRSKFSDQKVSWDF